MLVKTTKDITVVCDVNNTIVLLKDSIIGVKKLQSRIKGFTLRYPYVYYHNNDQKMYFSKSELKEI